MSIALRTLDWPAHVEAALGGKPQILRNLDWDDYQSFLEASGVRRLRHTYDNGSLEITPTSWEHEVYVCLLRMLFFVMAQELKRPFMTGGQLTLQRADLDRGVAPDQCYWFAHARDMEGKTEVDFMRDPPPDIFIEIELTRTLISRLPVLAALRVPEVWRCAGQALQVGCLAPNGAYVWGDQSPTFPEISATCFAPFLERAKHGEMHFEIAESFRVWLREHLGK